MKTKFITIIGTFLLVLTFSFFIISAEESKTELNKTRIVTQQDALSAISESEQIIQEMLKHNLPILYMNDTLIEAKRIFQQAKYAEILRGDIGATESEKSEARKALRFVDLEEISYADVLVYTDNIKTRKEKTFLLVDEITVEESKINQEQEGLFTGSLFSSPSAEPSEETKQILEDTKIAFQEDRYQDTENLLEEFRNALEQEKVEASTLSGIKKGAKNLFQKYWVPIIIILILLTAIGYLAYKRFEKKLIKRKIKKIKAEKEVLIKLMKKAQEDRFKKNLISGLVYNIRIKKYQEREQEIKQELPVLEARLEKLKKKNIRSLFNKN